LNKLLIAAFAAATIATPSMAEETAPKENNIFVVQAQKVVDGTRHITAVREDGQKTAYIEVTRGGKVKATVDGQPVNATLKDL